MKTSGYFVFKEIRHRDGGVFTNDKGQEIKYPEIFVLKADERLSDGSIIERNFKISKDNKSIISKLEQLKSYDTIKIIFDIIIYGNSCRLNPIDIEFDVVDDNE